MTFSGIDIRPRRLTSLLTLACLSTACKTTAVVLRPVPKRADITELNSLKSDAQGQSLGEGEQTLSGQQVDNRLYRISAGGYDPVFVYLLPAQNEAVVEVSLPRKTPNIEEKLAESESRVKALERLLGNEQGKSRERGLSFNELAMNLLLAERYLSAGAPSEAGQVVEKIFTFPTDVLPASAFTLRGKLYLLQGKKEAAMENFRQALQVFPNEIEARAYLGGLE